MLFLPFWERRHIVRDSFDWVHLDAALAGATWERQTLVWHVLLSPFWERRTLVRHVYLFHKKQRHASLKADFLCLFSIFSLCTLWTLCETCVFSFKTFHIKAWRSPINTRHLTKRYRSQEDCLQEGISLTCPF